MADETTPPPAASAQPEPPAAVNPTANPSANADASAAAPAPEMSAAAPAPEMSAADQAAIDELLKQASFDDPSAVGAPAAPGTAEAVAAAAAAGGTMPFDLPGFQQVMQEAQVSSIDLLRDVELNVKIELGRSRMLVEDVLKLVEGSVVELDKLAGDPVDVFVNDRLVARGEVLVLNDNFCVRVNEIVTGAKEEGQ